MVMTQSERNKKWEAKNKDYSNYLKNRSSARSFIRNKALEGDLDELENLIEERRNELIQ
ncbi:MAG: hypothetical protein ACRC57_01890 [Sarcina sp.]